MTEDVIHPERTLSFPPFFSLSSLQFLRGFSREPDRTKAPLAGVAGRDGWRGGAGVVLGFFFCGLFGYMPVVGAMPVDGAVPGCGSEI